MREKLEPVWEIPIWQLINSSDFIRSLLATGLLKLGMRPSEESGTTLPGRSTNSGSPHSPCAGQCWGAGGLAPGCDAGRSQSNVGDGLDARWSQSAQGYDGKNPGRVIKLEWRNLRGWESPEEVTDTA